MDEKIAQPQVGYAEELDAMRAVGEALKKVDSPSARRVLLWAAEVFGVSLGPATRPGRVEPQDPAPAPETEPVLDKDLGTFFHEVGPESGPEKVLVVGYFQQVLMSYPELDALSLNSELKNLGINLANITATLSNLISQSPALVMQTKKMGKGQQARKRYKLTTAGLMRVRELIARAKAANGKED